MSNERAKLSDSFFDNSSFIFESDEFGEHGELEVNSPSLTDPESPC